MKTSTSTKTVDILRKVLDSLRADSGKLRAKHTSLIRKLAEQPDSESIVDQITDVEANLARVAASIHAREEALTLASAEAREEAKQLAIQATADQRMRAIRAAQARIEIAKSVDEAAEQFIAALKAMRDASKPIADDTRDVIRARKSERDFLNSSGLALPHASCTSREFSFAVADVLRRVVDHIGADGLGDLVAVNRFTASSAAGRTFVMANEVAARQLEILL